MKQGWEIKTLLEVSVSIEDGDWIEKKDQSTSGIRLIQTGNIGLGYYKDKGEKAKYISEDTFAKLKCTELTIGDVLVSRLPDPVGRACILPDLGVRCITAVDCSIIKLKQDIIYPQWFVYYSLSSEYGANIKKECSGTTRDRISRKKLSCITVPTPTLAEQKRIVKILDREFEKIDALKANAERSLQQAKDLFQSALKQELQCDKYHNLNEVYNIKTGKLNSNAAEDGGIYPFFTCSREIFAINTYAFDCEAILLAGNNASGDFNVKYYNGKFNAYQRTYIITAKKAGINVRILYYILTNYLTTLKKMSLGANTKFLKLGMIETILIPNFDETHMSLVVGRLDDLSKNCKKLEENYTKTMALCDDMKQALLRQAFNGEL